MKACTEQMPLKAMKIIVQFFMYLYKPSYPKKNDSKERCRHPSPGWTSANTCASSPPQRKLNYGYGLVLHVVVHSIIIVYSYIIFVGFYIIIIIILCFLHHRGILLTLLAFHSPGNTTSLTQQRRI